MKKFLINHVWWIIFLASLVLLVAHSLSIATIKVDSTSVILLAILLVSPFISTLKKIKFGEFEAEIDPKEIQRVKTDVETKLPTGQAKESAKTPEYQLIVNGITSLIKSDHIIALAKLRIELEKLLNRLYRLSHKDVISERSIAIGKLVYELTNKEILPREISAPIRNVLSLCNRAIHGEDIRKEDTESIVEIGTTLLTSLFELASDYTVAPKEVIPIDTRKVEDYRNSMYKVTTIISYVNNPVKNIRILNQEGIDDLLEGYNEYAEFIVEIVKL